MLNYQELIKDLSSERKISLWSKYKDSPLSQASKFKAIYYDALSKGYLTK